jgi:hypothetical protein
MIVKYKDKAISTKKLAYLTFSEVYSYFYTDTFRFLVECICLLTSDNLLPLRKKKLPDIGVIEARLIFSHIEQIKKLETLLKETILYQQQFKYMKKHGKQIKRHAKFSFEKEDLKKEYPPREVVYLVIDKTIPFHYNYN